MTTKGNGNSTRHSDWDQQREQLSAYLDGELDAGERKRLEAHLVDCAACQRELAELRQVRALLRALPAPALPRSFTLPVEEPAIASSVRRAPTTQTAATRPAPRQEGRLARAAQWTGGLAASVGLLLILGSALVGGAFNHPGAASSSYAPAASSSQRSTNSSTGSSAATHPPQVGTNGNATQTPRSISSAAPSASPAATPAQPNDTGTATFGPSTTPSSGSNTGPMHTPYGAQNPPSSSSTVVGLTGGGLAGGGALLFVGGSIARRRRGKKR